MKTIDGQECLPIGSRVRHKRTGLLGTIQHYEMHESGSASAVPYNVRWDDEDEAKRLLGTFWFWACDKSVEGCF